MKKKRTLVYSRYLAFALLFIGIGYVVHSAVNYNNELTTVNYQATFQENAADYTFQVKYPGSFIATTDDMMTTYRTQGGMAAPLLAFTKKPLQPLGDNSDNDLVWDTKEACILIWNVSDDTYQDWKDRDVEIRQNSSAGTKKVKQYGENGNVEVYTTDKNWVAFLHRNPGISYVFETCGQRNSEFVALETILENLKFRPGNL